MSLSTITSTRSQPSRSQTAAMSSCCRVTPRPSRVSSLLIRAYPKAFTMETTVTHGFDKADTGLLGPGVLAPGRILDAIVDERLESSIEIRAADLVGDEQGLARGVSGGIGEPGLEVADGPAEVP